MPVSPFEFLTESDRQRLFQGARRQSYRRGQILFAEGDEQLHLYVVRQGLVRVERKYEEKGVAVARYGPGDVVGEVSFLQGHRAQGSVIAEEDVEVDVLERQMIEALLAADSGLAARFYHSLALCLGTRLLQITPGIRLPKAFRGGPGADLPRIGHLSDRQYPRELTAGVEDFRAALHALASDLREGRVDAAIAQQRLSQHCDALVGLLERFTQNDALVQIGLEDPRSFRDVAELARGVGGYVLLDTFRFFMRSATIELGYTRPRGYAEDRELLDRIERNEAEGDGRLGPLIDRWFLSRPLCQARRNSVGFLTGFLKKAAAPAPGPVRLTSLSAGTAREVFDLLAGTPGPLAVTCLDADPDTLLDNKEQAEHQGYGDRVTFLQADLPRLFAGQTALSLGLQHVIYGLGVCDYLSDEEVRALLGWAHDHLDAGGWLVLTNRDKASPDRAFTEHILNWPVIHRSAADFGNLFAASRFQGLPLEMKREEAGVNLLAVCRKPQS
jgi:extracellular factor (EF) 3-hydroxypalmitic acid methyl ester biosynthesis protein